MAVHTIIVHDYGIPHSDPIWNRLESWKPESLSNPGWFKTSRAAKIWLRKLTNKPGWFGVYKWHIDGSVDGSGRKVWTVWLELEKEVRQDAEK